MCTDDFIPGVSNLHLLLLHHTRTGLSVSEQQLQVSWVAIGFLCPAGLGGVATPAVPLPQALLATGNE